MKDYEEEYEDFWKELVEVNGVVDMDKVRRELHDYSRMMKECGEVFCHVTNSRISKPNTKAFEVIAIHDDIRSEEIEEAKKEQFGLGN